MIHVSACDGERPSCPNPGGLPCFSLFRDDGAALQMATVTGSVSEGFVATLTVGVAG